MTFTSGVLPQWAPNLLQRFNCVLGASDVCTTSVTRTSGRITMLVEIVKTLGDSLLSTIYGRR